MKTKLRGVEFRVSPKEVKKAAKNLPKGWGRKYAVEIEGNYFPPKDVILELLSSKFEENGEVLTRMDFTTMDAVRILRRLGFKTVSKKEIETPRRKKLSSLAGLISLGGDSVKDSEDYYE